MRFVLFIGWVRQSAACRAVDSFVVSLGTTLRFGGRFDLKRLKRRIGRSWKQKTESENDRFDVESDFCCRWLRAYRKTQVKASCQ